MAKLSGYVHLLSPETGRTVTFGPDDGDHTELPEWVVAKVRNPRSWEDGDVPPVPEGHEDEDPDAGDADDGGVSLIAPTVAALAEQVAELTRQVIALTELVTDEREAREQAERAAAEEAAMREAPTRAEELDTFTLKRLQDEVAPTLGIDGSRFRTKPPLIEEIIARENETPEQRADREARERAEEREATEAQGVDTPQ